MFANGRTNAEREAHDWFRRSLEANRNHTLSHFQFAGAPGLDGIVSWGALNRKVERVPNSDHSIVIGASTS